VIRTGAPRSIANAVPSSNVFVISAVVRGTSELRGTNTLSS